MKKYTTKILALCLGAVLAFCGIATTAFALNTDQEKTGKAPAAPAVSAADSATDDADDAAVKDETVYVLAGANGSVQKIIVSDWIKNTLGAPTLADRTDLTGVENVKGDEGYTMGSDDTCVWDAQGNDIYYQGNIEKELPVDLSVTYKLNGKTISPDELAGKSGRVTIRFDYQNKQYEMVDIDGKQEKIYVPFAMLTGVLLDDDVFTNVEVSNGKLINDGSRTAVIGIAFPGLQEDLAISKDKFDIPDHVEITADAKDLALGMTVTLATNELFSELDTDSLDSVSQLSHSMEELTDAMDQLLDGSSQLYDGLSTLLDSSGRLVEGIDTLTSGAEELKNGAGNLDTGAAALQSGAAQLSDGLNTLASNNGTLNSGAEQVFETLLSAADTQLAAAGLKVPALTIGNYADVLNGVIASLDENAVYEQALSTVTAAVKAQQAYIEQQVTAAVKEQVTSQVAAAVKEQVTAQVTQAVREAVLEQVIQSALQMEKAEYDAAVSAGQIDKATQDTIEAAVGQQMQTEPVLAEIQAKTDGQMVSQTIQGTITVKVEEQMQSDTIKQTIAQQTEAQIQKAISENMASEEVQEKLTAAASGARSVITLKTSLDSYNAFYLGLQTYTASVAEAASGAGALKTGTDDLKAGTSQLYSGTSKLYDGILPLKEGTAALIDGVTQLRDGSMQLSDGLKEFNEQGIQKLTDAVNGDLDSLLIRFRATKDVSLHYKNFAGASEKMDGQVKFIYRTESIG